MTSEIKNVFSEEYKQKINNEPNYSEKLKLIRPNILYFCKNRIWDQSEAEDVCQNTLFILSSKKSDYDSSKSFFSWALKICNFQIKAILKKYKRSRLVYGYLGINPPVNNNYGDDLKGLMCSEFYSSKITPFGEDFEFYWDGATSLNTSAFPIDSPDLPDISKFSSTDVYGNTLTKDFFVIDDNKLFELLTLNLNKREELIFNLMREGYTNKEIGKKIKLNVSATTTAKTRLIKKLKIRLHSIQDYNKYDYQEL